AGWGGGGLGMAGGLGRRRSGPRLYKVLATLRIDVPLSEDVDALRWQGALRGELPSLCASLGEASLPDRVQRWRD
ncbi:MAG TPA: hypothetical protein PKC83_09925, partial [Gemmatimonadaceae bacterium]|nr:hypothetical protein [Gemmatimonadaceae bacterium]